MALNSGRKSGSSDHSTSRKRVVIGAQETVRVSYKKDKPQVESERRRTQRQTRASSARPGMTGPKPTGAGRKIASVKRDERERRQRSLARRRILVILAAVGAAFAFGWALLALWQAPLFSVKSVKVIGASHLSQAAVLKTAAVPSDATLLRLPVGRIEQSLARDPWVSSVHVSRRFPDTVVITVVERSASALVDAGGTSIWLVDKEAHWLGRRTAEDTAALVMIRDIEHLDPVAGVRSESPELRNALAVISGLSPELRTMIRAVSAPSVDKTALITFKDVQVFIGSSEDIEKKDRIAREILHTQKNVVYINVRVVERPTWRGLDTPN